MDGTQTDDAREDALARFKAEAWPLLPSLLRVAMILTRNEHQAEDLAQETMMRAYRHIKTFQTGTNMKAWLMTILRRVHIDQYRKDARRIDAGSLDAMAHEPAAPAPGHSADESPWSAPDELLSRFDDVTIEDALRALPDPMRWVLLLVDVEQMSVAEAAEALDVAPGTIKSRASRARAGLRALLEPVARERGWVKSPVEG